MNDRCVQANRKAGTAFFSACGTQFALLFDPQSNNIMVFYPTSLSEEEEAALRIVEPDRTERMEKVEAQLHYPLYGLPFFMKLNSFGFYAILLVGACLIARQERAKGLSVVTVPLLAAMTMVVLGPCIECQDRYGFPIMYSMPLVLICLGFLLHQNKNAEHYSLQIDRILLINDKF